MANNAFPYTPELRAFQAADDAWDAELVRLYGRSAGQARYEALGIGEDGSELRRLFHERCAAMAAWHRSAY